MNDFFENTDHKRGKELKNCHFLSCQRKENVLRCAVGGVGFVGHIGGVFSGLCWIHVGFCQFFSLFAVLHLVVDDGGLSLPLNKNCKFNSVFFF
jgi:hypothetical protein